MFALAIYDTRRRTLFAARDHLGQKPLYYHHDGQNFAFASEIKALLALKPELREMDPQALYEYMTIRVITPPRSMFSRVRKLPPGHWLKFEDGKVEIQRYWQLNYEPKWGGDLDAMWTHGLQNRRSRFTGDRFIVEAKTDHRSITLRQSWGRRKVPRSSRLTSTRASMSLMAVSGSVTMP